MSKFVVVTLLYLSSLCQVNGFNMFDFNSNSDSVADSQLERPKLSFPESFEIGMSTNDPGINVTELIYYDKTEKKLRIQIFYSILGLDATKGLDIVLDELNKVFAIQSEHECKQSQFKESLYLVELFFNMFDSLTDYMGIDSEGLHVYKVKQFGTGTDYTPKFYFLFDQDHQFVKSRLEQYHVGAFDFSTVVPLKAKTFGKDDWYQDNCEIIQDSIIQEGTGFISFMQQLMNHLVGNETDILQFLGLDPSASTSIDDDDEDFCDDDDCEEVDTTTK